MPALRPIRLLIALFVLGCLVWSYAPWPSRTVSFEKANCRCDIPYNWSFKDNPKYVVEADGPGDRAAFIIVARPATETSDVTSPAFADSLKKNLEARGHEVLDEHNETFQGRPCLVASSRTTTNGHDIYIHSTLFVAGKVRYDLVVSKVISDPMQDPKLSGIVNSFSLITP